MATFAAINTSLVSSASGPAGQEPTPTTPRPAVRVPEQTSLDVTIESSPNTPTKDSFGGIPGQRPLPDEPFTPSRSQDQYRGNDNATDGYTPSHHGAKAAPQDQQDVEMGEGDDMDDCGEDDVSDNDSVTSDSQRPSKKKKGQRFFCTDFPPCQLSFTRSEHLARHIRKHTGERPFQCHCSRRFSRLDNLRQHAQTVHVNEEIPDGSLAATSTRFQRQIRTDRVRPPNRSRASTMGSQGGHSRGHSRNLSTSSIGSTTSSVSIVEESRRRPQPLAMANDPSARARLSIDTFNGGSGGNAGQPFNNFYNSSPTGYSTATSATFSTGLGSPRFQSGMMSPASTVSRSSYYNGARASGRRLSVPAGNPVQGQNTTYPPPAYHSPMQSGTYSQNSSTLVSPTSSVFSHGRHESESEMEYRRRTWHPSSSSQYTQRPATSGLSYYQTPDEPRPAFSQQPVAASQMTRLPGIESFDHVPLPAARQQPSPMMVDVSPRPPSSGRPIDASLNQGLTRLDITAANAPNENHWHSNQSASQTQPTHAPQQGVAPPQQFVHPQHISMPEPPVTPRRNKRNAWYGGPLAPAASGYLSHRPSPEDSGSSDGVPTPSMSQANEFHPVIVNANVPMEPYPPGARMTEEQKAYYNDIHEKPDPVRTDSGYQTYGQPPPTYVLQSGHDPRSIQSSHEPSNMSKLDALVAVATSEGSRAVEHRS